MKNIYEYTDFGDKFKYLPGIIDSSNKKIYINKRCSNKKINFFLLNFLKVQ